MSQEDIRRRHELRQRAIARLESMGIDETHKNFAVAFQTAMELADELSFVQGVLSLAISIPGDQCNEQVARWKRFVKHCMDFAISERDRRQPNTTP